jgi:hypothetical protein
VLVTSFIRLSGYCTAQRARSSSQTAKELMMHPNTPANGFLNDARQCIIGLLPVMCSI